MFFFLFLGWVVFYFGAWAEKANHMGSSGMVYGLFSFLVIKGFVLSQPKAIFISVITLLVYGGLLKGLFPSKNKSISWEGHLFYAIAGILAVYLNNNEAFISILNKIHI